MFSGFLNWNKSGNASQRNAYHITDFYEYFQKKLSKFSVKIMKPFLLSSSVHNFQLKTITRVNQVILITFL